MKSVNMVIHKTIMHMTDGVIMKTQYRGYKLSFTGIGKLTSMILVLGLTFLFCLIRFKSLCE